MADGLSRPPGRDVTRRNTPEVIYLKGDEDTDGSRRIFITSPDSVPEFQERVSGVWVLGSVTFSTGAFIVDDIKGELVLDETGEFVREGI